MYELERMHDMNMEVERCPYCNTPFDTSKYRKLTESCGHVICRQCALLKDGCSQCKSNEETRCGYPNDGEMISPNDASSSSSPSGSKTPAEFVKVELKETSTLFTIALPGKPDLIWSDGHNPVFIHDAYTYTFTADSDQDPKEHCITDTATADVSGLPSGIELLKSISPSSSSSPPAACQDREESQQHGFRIGDSADQTSSSARKTHLVDYEDSGTSSDDLPNDDTATPSVPEIDNSNPKNSKDSSDSSKVQRRKTSGKRPLPIPEFITVLHGDPPRYQCNICQRKFKTKYWINYHAFCQKGESGTTRRKQFGGKGRRKPKPIPSFITVFEGDPPTYKCNICKRKFKTKFRIKYHFFCGKDDVEKPYRCAHEKCGKGFVDKANYEHHLRTHKCKKPFVCYCGKAFKYRSNLKAHKRSQNHDKIAKRPNKAEDFMCSYCDKRFPFLDDLKMHLMIHLDVFPFNCSICAAPFRYKHDLVGHCITAHGQSKTVAEKMANDAGLEYLKKTTKDLVLDSIPFSKISSVVISTALKNSNLILPHGIVTDADADLHLPTNINRKKAANPPEKGALSSSSPCVSSALDPEIDVVTLD